MKMGQNLGILSSVVAAIIAGPFSGNLTAAEPHSPTSSSAEAKRIFNQRCTACHSYGKGVKVGPDLKGVTDRRDRPWLLAFIRSSQTLINRGDPVAKGLFSQFKQQRMPDWTDLTDGQIASVLDWLASNGPEQKEIDERNAQLATPKDLDMGHGLFTGRIRLENGGLACISCHSIKAGPGVAPMPLGGTLGPNLTESYARFQDSAMTLFLKRPCFPRAPETGEYLRPQESFALKALLRLSSTDPQKRASNANAALNNKQGGAK
jgi:mono/diheme cytochrome c family protein